ncbi:hypothetical protein [Maribacter arcticus]|uniref:hypothetical protein n=1 Tax=Maribacter arcticus TaxID=561365 RepID=UPI0030012365
MEIGHFKISGHSTKRNWAVYIFVATPKNESDKIILYVGKVGDNRAGCNPVISRVGNHFSYNKIHSQIRNAIPDTENYDYEYFYCHFDKYETEKELWESGREKTNELERELNRIVQKNMDETTAKFLNPYGGHHVSKADNQCRSELLTEEEKSMLEKLCAKAL